MNQKNWKHTFIVLMCGVDGKIQLQLLTTIQFLCTNKLCFPCVRSVYASLSYCYDTFPRFVISLELNITCAASNARPNANGEKKQ